MMKSLKEGHLKGFMMGIMSYNFKNFKEFNKDSHALIEVVKHRINTKVREKFEYINIKRNGKEITLKIDKEKESKKMA